MADSSRVRQRLYRRNGEVYLERCSRLEK